MEEEIMNEIVEECEECLNRECCLEEDCVLFRIEKLVEENDIKIN